MNKYKRLLKKVKVLLSEDVLTSVELSDGLSVEFSGDELGDGTELLEVYSADKEVTDMLEDGSYKTKDGVEFTLENGIVKFNSESEDESDESESVELESNESESEENEAVESVELEEGEDDEEVPMEEDEDGEEVEMEVEERLTQLEGWVGEILTRLDSIESEQAELIDALTTHAEMLEKVSKEPAVRKQTELSSNKPNKTMSRAAQILNS